MWILSVDTALRNCNVVLAQNDKVIHEVALSDEITHSSRVLEAVDEVLEKAGITLTNLDGLGVTTGPGSFTGLRIGLSTVKGLAFGLNRPVAGIGLLEALANQVLFVQGVPVAVFVDGGKQEVFTQRFFMVNGSILPMGDPENLSYAAVAASITENTIVTGNGVPLIEPGFDEIQREMAQINNRDAWTLTNKTLAKLVYNRFESGKVVDGAIVTPNYVRKSDAEISLKKAL